MQVSSPRYFEYFHAQMHTLCKTILREFTIHIIHERLSRLQIFAIWSANPFCQYDVAVRPSLSDTLDDSKRLASFGIELVPRYTAHSDALCVLRHNVPHSVVNFLGKWRCRISGLGCHDLCRAVHEIVQREEAAAGIHGRRQVYPSEGHKSSRRCLCRHLPRREVTVTKNKSIAAGPGTEVRKGESSCRQNRPTGGNTITKKRTDAALTARHRASP